MAGKRFAIRTIRNGKVRINGKTFKPAHYPHPTAIPYSGQLDGHRFAFGLYHIAGKWDSKFVSLWGTERAYKSDDPRVDYPGPNYVNGYFQWDWWDAE